MKVFVSVIGIGGRFLRYRLSNGRFYETRNSMLKPFHGIVSGKKHSPANVLRRRLRAQRVTSFQRLGHVIAARGKAEEREKERGREGFFPLE